MAKRSPEKLLKLFESNEMVEFKDIQSALDNASRATCFRYLQQVPYHRSYNHNGRYYTRKDPTRYDRFGLFSYGDIFFSRDNTLGETIRRLVWESEAGWTQRELQDVLRVRVQVVLLHTFHQGKVRPPDLRDFDMAPAQENTYRECGQTGYGKPSPRRLWYGSTPLRPESA